jgi:prepilin-type N-terminal cleavage/methylation domain-containing protein
MKKGFTLIELLIVMVIISALLRVATPVALNALSKAKATQVSANLRNISQALLATFLTYDSNYFSSIDNNSNH